MATYDERLAKELNNLSLEKREEILEEMHCVKSATVEESPELIESSIHNLQNEIAALPIKDRKAYEESLASNGQYFLKREVQLKFLRAERLNAKCAAVRLAKNAKILHKYFGTVALQRPIQLSDLSKEEQQLLRHGHYQILPSRDRMVYSMCQLLPNQYPTENDVY